MKSKSSVINRIPKCNHCGGTLRQKDGMIRCLMCGRYADHICENCMSATHAQEKYKKTA